MTRDSNPEVASDWLRCPLCRGQVFYAESGSGDLAFFRVHLNRRAHPCHPDQPILPEMLESFYCAGCSWYGAIAELLEE